MAFDLARTKRLALLSLLFSITNSIVGRTKLQKIAYLADSLGWKAFDFYYHHYGPYSDSLFSELESLQKIGWIKEEPTGETRDGSPLYRYSFAWEYVKRRDILISRFQTLNPQNSKLVGRTRGLVNSLQNKTGEELEIMATLFYLRRENQKLSNEQLVELAYELKPNYGRQDFRDGMSVFGLMKHHAT